MIQCHKCGDRVHRLAVEYHRRHECRRNQQRVRFARYLTEPEPPLLAAAWAQIEDILVETGFVR